MSPPPILPPSVLPPSVFGKDIDKLVKIIKENEKLFKKIPIGPIGRYVSIKPGYESYTMAANACLSNFLTNFIVDNNQDKQTLSQLSQRSHGVDYTRIGIITIEFDAVATPYCIKSSNDRTINNIINVSNPIVANVLVDVAQIEQTLVADNIEQGKLMGHNNIYTADGEFLWEKCGAIGINTFHSSKNLLVGGIF